MKQYRCKRMDPEMFKDQFLIELLSAGGKVGDLFYRLMQRLWADTFYGFAWDRDIAELEQKGCIRLCGQGAAAYCEIALPGIKRAQARREELFREYCLLKRGSRRARRLWHQQMIRKPR